MKSTIEADLYAQLSGDSALTALVGQRIFPLLIPQDVTRPALAYQSISVFNPLLHDGAAPMRRVRMQISIVADTFTKALAVRDSVYEALQGQGRNETHVWLFETERHEYGDNIDVTEIQMDWFCVQAR
jgi:hypothetical protein